MKTSKLFKKSALLIAVIVCAVVLTVTAIATATLLLVEDDFGVDYYGASVATAGRAKINFYFDDTGDAEKFVVRVVEPSNVAPAEEAGVQEYDVECLVDNMPVKGEQKYISVPLAPSQMTYTVEVYAVKGNQESFVAAQSIQNYAKSILADPALSDYHNSMVALLNWGAMAQDYFNQAEAYPANAGLFARGTNPKNAVSAINAPDFKATAAGGFTTPTYQLYLAPEDVYVQLNFAYSGEGELSANVSKDGAEAKPTTVHKNEDGTCYVKLSNLGVTVYDSTYTVTVTDGTDTLTFNGSLLGILKGYLDKDAANVVKSMYQFYQQTVAPVTACNHGNRSQTFWTAEGVDAAKIKCSICYAEIGHQTISNGVNDYVPGSLLQFGSQTGSADVTVMDEDGVQFVRVDNMWANRDNWGDIGIAGVLSSNTVTGQYMVIRYRVGAEGNASTYIEGFANTNLGSEKNLTGKGEFKIVHGANNEWVTAVIDLSKRVNDPNVAFVPAEDGSYDVQYFSLRLFPYAAQAVTDDSAAGRYVYTYGYNKSVTVNGEGKETVTYAKYETYNGTKLTDEELAAKVAEHADYELVKIGKQNISEDAYVDVAYVAFADSMADIKTLIDTKTYAKSVSNSANEIYNTADDSCAHVSRDSAEHVDGNTYSYGICAQCGEAVYTKTIADSVKAYITPYRMSVLVNKNTDNATNPRVHYNMGNKKFVVENGNAYFSFIGADGAAQFIWNRGPGVNGYAEGNSQDYTIDIGKANYLVVRMRISETALSKTFGITYSTTGANASTYSAMPVAAATAGEWETYVIDLAKVYGAQHALDAESNTYKIDTFYFHCDGLASTTKIDIAHMAFVEGDWEDIAKIAETDTAILQKTTSGAGIVVDVETGLCAGGCATGAVQVVDGVYKYVCPTCGGIIKDYGVSADAANVYWPAEMLYSKGTESNTYNGWASTTGKYNQKELITENGETFYRIGDAESNKVASGAWAGWFPITSDGKAALENSGRYMVFKVRQNKNTLNASSMNMLITSTKSGTTWAEGSFSISLPADDQWHVIVIDLATRSGKFEANDDGTYGVRTIHIRPFNGGSGAALDATTDEVMDFAYWAFFDDLDNLKNIIDEDTYEYSKSATVNSLYDTLTHSCAGTHSYKDFVTGTTHTIKCEDCGIVANTFEIPAEINYYTDLSIMNNYGATLKINLWDETEKMFYNNFTSTGGCHFNLTGGGGAGTWTSATYNSGKYVVIKYRSNVTEEMYVGTKDTGTLAGQTNPNRASIGKLAPSDTWKIQVLEIPDNCASYTVNSQQNLYFMVGSQAGSFDVAYLAVVDNVDEAILLLGEGETFFYNGAHLDKNKQCVGLCNYAYTEDASAPNGYEYVCPNCGSATDINFFRADFYNGYNTTAVKMDGFTRFTFSDSGHLNLSYSETEGRGGIPSKEQVVAGQYLAIKFRADLTSSLQIRIGNTNEFAANGWNYAMNDAGSVQPAYVTADEWRILVVDLSNFNDAEYEIGKKHGILLSTQGGGATTMDVAWVAVGDSIEEIKSLFTADDTTYYDFGTSYSNVPSHKNLDGSCAEHVYDPSTETATRTEGENTVYYYTCTVCSQEAWSRTAAAGTTVIDHIDMKTPVSNVNKTDTTISTHFCMTNGAVVKEDNPYFTFKGNDQSHKTCIFIWTRSLADNGASQTSSHEQYSIDVGEAKYLVIKMRADIAGVSPSGFSFKISTTGADKNDVFCIPADQFKGEWITMVFDLETVCANWVKDETTGHYLVDSLWFSVNPVLTSDTIDIEYMAFVEGDWSDVDTIVEEETVISMTKPGTNNYDIVYVADGSKKD